MQVGMKHPRLDGFLHAASYQTNLRTLSLVPKTSSLWISYINGSY